MKKNTWHIHIMGQVQGVGFRPYVYQKALELDLKGWVNNTIDGVHCEFNATEKGARDFVQLLIDKAPALSDITAHRLQKVKSQNFTTFRIIHSTTKGEANLLLTPDFALCEDCREELFAEKNRRRAYAFITCTNCGPRYSITEKLPYDRETTTMNPFLMCDCCQKEYEDPLNRRYYSQTNSCGDCGISMAFCDASQNVISSQIENIISKVMDFWKQGEIVAIKGIGGYLLTCDAANQEAIKKLRERKQRPTKPFAVMYPDIETLEGDILINAKEKAALTGPVSPIILSALKKDPVSGICLPEIVPGLSRLGVMIPYTPLYALLLKSFSRPIIATSGNISGSPIVFKNQKALDNLVRIADYILTNNRDISVPQDDSVMAFTPQYRRKIIYRRSRGVAPSYINPQLKLPDQTVLATGAMLKSTFTYLHHQNVFISQYIGDTAYFDTEQSYRHTLEHFFCLFGEHPQLVLADTHPDYFSTRYAEQLSEELDIPIKKYQHHEAHFAAVLGEHGLLDSAELVLGVIWDGTGLGDDGQIWGGEFFVYEDYTFNRCAHFSYFDFIAGDKMPREPRLSALAAAVNVKGADALLKKKFTDLEWNNYQMLLQKSDSLKTSSVGRLFDAVSSLLGLIDHSGYEGEAAMLLENKAREYLQEHGLAYSRVYTSDTGTQNLSTTELIQGVIDDLQNGTAGKEIAAKFHCTLVEIIHEQARQMNASKIAFSGGVFQNALLVDLLQHHLGDTSKLYFHTNLSPNDENISFGQLMSYQVEAIKEK